MNCFNTSIANASWDWPNRILWCIASVSSMMELTSWVWFYTSISGIKRYYGRTLSVQTFSTQMYAQLAMISQVADYRYHRFTARSAMGRHWYWCTSIISVTNMFFDIFIMCEWRLYFLGSFSWILYPTPHAVPTWITSMGHAIEPLRLWYSRLTDLMMWVPGMLTEVLVL